MPDFPIPHTPPIRFVKKLLSSDEQKASVEVEFESVASLGMFVEAAAQSSSGILSQSDDIQRGFLVTLKNIKLLQEPKSTIYIIDVYLEHKLENFKSFSFSVFDDGVVVATGSFSVVLQ
jgi:hypothetical protein